MILPNSGQARIANDVEGLPNAPQLNRGTNYCFYECVMTKPGKESQQTSIMNIENV